MLKKRQAITKANKKRQQLKGIIVSDKMNQTAVVRVETLKQDKIYKKRYRVFRRYLAHNPADKFKLGEKVLIEQTRPLSKRKRWVIKSKK